VERALEQAGLRELLDETLDPLASVAFQQLLDAGVRLEIRELRAGLVEPGERRTGERRERKPFAARERAPQRGALIPVRLCLAE